MKGIVAGGLAVLTLAAGSFAVDAPRTSCYAGIMQDNIAADLTTADYVTRPYLIDRQYVAGYYLSDSTGNATFALQGIGLNWFGDVNNSGLAARFKVGAAVTNVFGAGIILEANKESNQVINTVQKRTDGYSYYGDGIGVFGGLNIGFGGIYAQVIASTNQLRNDAVKIEPITPPPVASSSYDNALAVNAKAGWRKDAIVQGDMALGGEIVFQNVSHVQDNGTAKVTDSTATSFDISGMIGCPVKKEADFSVFIGATPTISFGFQKDNITRIEGSNFKFLLTPSIGFQKEIANGFEGQFGASATILDIEVASEKDATTTTNTSQFISPRGTVALGLRWKKDNLLIDGRLGTDLLSDGPFFISGKAGSMFGGLGVSLGF